MMKVESASLFFFMSSARPKSVIFTTSSLPSMMLSGLMSRWTTPIRAEKSSAIAHLNMISTTLCGGSSLSKLQCSRSATPLTNSIAMYANFSSMSASKIETMFGCLTFIASAASVANSFFSRRLSLAFDWLKRITFNATIWLVSVCTAR